MKASEKQIAYAMSISKILNISLPSSNDYFEMGAFIAKNKEKAAEKQEDLNRELYARIKREIKIEDIARELGFTIVRKGEYLSTKEHDSIRINAEKNIFIRNSSGEKGTVIDFIECFTNQSKKEIIEDLVRRLERTSPAEPFIKREDTETLKERAKTLELPPQAPHMRNVFAYLTKVRYIEPEVIQELVNRKQIYQDVRKNCVFVSYNDEKKENFACLKGTNTYTPYTADVRGCDYQSGWFVDNHSTKLYVTEAPIDAMSKMSLLYKTDTDYHDFDYLSLTGTGKWEMVLVQLQKRNYKEICIGTDGDRWGKECAEKIKTAVQQADHNVKVVLDLPKIKKDWNEEMIYLFNRQFRLENYINPSEENLKLLSEHMEALILNDPVNYQIVKAKLEKNEIPLQIEDYMLQYMKENPHVSIERGKGSSLSVIEEILGKYNKNIPLEKAFNTYNRKIPEIEIG